MDKLGVVGGTVCASAELLCPQGLVKGVGGRVEKSMNIMFGFAEIHGLWQLPRHP